MATRDTYQPSRPYVPQMVFYALWLVVLAVLIGVPGVVLTALVSYWFALVTFGLFVFGVIAPLLQGLVNIPANPPHRGVRTFLGQRYRGILSEGWHIRLGYPWLYGFVLVNVERKNLDFKPENVRTPDTAELEVPISITYTPTTDNLLAFLNSGGEEGVKNILDDIVGEAVREWASAADRGPKDWREAYQAHAEAIRVVMNALAGRDPQVTLNPDEVARMRGGNGEVKSVAYGITVNRVNITQIKVLGGLAEAAEKQAIEAAQMAGEKIERDFLVASVKKLTKAGLKPGEAVTAFQVERGKVTRTEKTNVVGVTPETLKGAGEVIGSAIAALRREKKEGEES